MCCTCVDPEGGGGGMRSVFPTWKITKLKGPLAIKKDTKQAFNVVGPSSACQRNAIVNIYKGSYMSINIF